MENQAEFFHVDSTVLSDDDAVEKFRREKFDLGVTELIEPCGLAYFHKIGLQKYVTTDSLTLNEYITKPLGIESNPTIFSPLSDNMSYLQRLKNLSFYILTHVLEHFTWSHEYTKVYNRHLADYDPKKAIQKSAFVMVNSEEYLDYPRPITHKIIYIGGIGVSQPKPLNKYYQKLLDNLKNGAVFVSFGSILRSETMPLEKKEQFLQTFRNFPEVIFFKIT
uniref:glucuronosyltransferase n=1 Tax=Syphacia muris TaxID=451379 RepID=A0A0N5ACR0_9BILA